MPRSPRKSVLLTIASAVTCAVAFILMQLAFGAAGDEGPMAFETLGFVLFVLFLASGAATLVDLIGTVVRLVRQ